MSSCSPGHRRRQARAGHGRRGRRRAGRARSPTRAMTSRSTAPTSRRTRTSCPSGWPTRSTSAAGASQGDTFAVMDALRELGVEVWFNLGDRDLAWCLERARLLAEGLSPTAALARLNAAIGVRARVLPMSDDPVRTWVRTGTGWHSVPGVHDPRARRGDSIEGLEFRGAEQAPPSAQALAAIAGARAIVIGPSNPLASIAPILARARHPRGARRGRGARRRRQPDRRRRGAEGPDGGVHGVRRARAAAPTGWPTSTASCSTGSSPTRTSARLATLQIDTRMDDASQRARGVAERDARLRRGPRRASA